MYFKLELQVDVLYLFLFINIYVGFGTEVWLIPPPPLQTHTIIYIKSFKKTFVFILLVRANAGKMQI
jgi:hypothetical protein